MTQPPVQPPNAAAPANSAPADLRDTIDLIRDQVDILQVQAAEQQRPWYRQMSTLLSVIALAVSVIFSSLSVYFRQQDKLEADKEHNVSRVRQNVSDLAELQVQQGEALARAGTNAQMTANIGSAYNVKRQLLIEETESLINSSSARMTSALYVSFANQLAADARVEDAAVYFRLALDAAKTNIARSNVHRGFAMAMMIPGPQQKLVDGRNHWRAALSALARTPDDYAVFLTADNLRVWALLERSVGDARLGDSLMDSSRKVIEGIRNPTARAQMQNLLASDGPPVASTVGLPNPGSIMGDWQVRLSDGRRGTLSLAVNPINQMWSAQVSLTEGGRVVEARQGYGPPTDGNSVMLIWQGQRYSTASPVPVPTSGTMRLRRSGTGRLVGSDEVLGGVPVMIELVSAPVTPGVGSN